jgi:hypothetical protein
MLTSVTFIASLFFICALFLLKGIEVNTGRKIFYTGFFLTCDRWILIFFKKINNWYQYINIHNLKLIFSWFIANIKRSIIVLKRRFDHKQSHFFIKREHHFFKSRGSVSSFLKHVSDYKKSLRDNKQE